MMSKREDCIISCPDCSTLISCTVDTFSSLSCDNCGLDFSTDDLIESLKKLVNSNKKEDVKQIEVAKTILLILEYEENPNVILSTDEYCKLFLYDKKYSVGYDFSKLTGKNWEMLLQADCSYAQECGFDKERRV